MHNGSPVSSIAEELFINNNSLKGALPPKQSTPMKAVPEELVRKVSDHASSHGSRTGGTGRLSQGSLTVSSVESSPANSRPSSGSSVVSSQSSLKNSRPHGMIESSKWVDVKNNSRSNSLEMNGLSVTAVDLNASAPGRMKAVQESPAKPLTNGTYEIDSRDCPPAQHFDMGLSRTKSQSTGELDGWREKDDGQDDVFIVDLDKSDNGIGLGLIDGLFTPLRSPGIYVRTLVPDGPAVQDGRLRLGDRILAVNGTSLVGADYQSAMDQIRNAGLHLSFLVAKSDQNVAMKITASSC